MGGPGTALPEAGAAIQEPAPVVAEVMSTEDRWKEQIGFITAYVLVVGVSAMQLWSTTASFQTERNISILSMNTPGQGLDVSLIEYQFLVIALAGALTAIGLSVVHILGRGLWLGIGFRSDGQSSASHADVGQGLRRLSAFAYDATLVLVLYFVAYLALLLCFLLSAAIEHLLQQGGRPLSGAGGIGRMGAVVILFILGIYLLLKFKEWAASLMYLLFKEVGLKTVMIS